MDFVLVARHPTYGLLWFSTDCFLELFDTTDGRFATLKPERSEWEIDSFLQSCSTTHIRSGDSHVGKIDRFVTAVYLWRSPPQAAPAASC